VGDECRFSARTGGDLAAKATIFAVVSAAGRPAVNLDDEWR